MARKRKNVELTIDTIIDEVSQYEELKKVTFDDGKFTEIYKKFDPKKVDIMLKECGEFLAEFEKHGGNIMGDDIEGYLFIHIVMHFSTICKEIPKEFPEKLNLFSKLLRSKYIRQLQDKFDKKELAYVYEVLHKRLEDAQNMLNANIEIRDKLLKYVDESNMKNKDIIKSVIFKQGESDA